jgi:hypothetical protein
VLVTALPAGLILFGGGTGVAGVALPADVTSLSGVTLSPAGLGCGCSARSSYIVCRCWGGAIALFLSTVTDSALGAAMGALAVLVTSQVLVTLDAAAAIRPYLPTRYWLAWIDFFREPILWRDIERGAGIQAGLPGRAARGGLGQLHDPRRHELRGRRRRRQRRRAERPQDQGGDGGVGGQVAVRDPGRGRDSAGYVHRAVQPGRLGRLHGLVVLGPDRQPRQPRREGRRSSSRSRCCRGRAARHAVGRRPGRARADPGDPRAVQRGAERDDPAGLVVAPSCRSTQSRATTPPAE